MKRLFRDKNEYMVMRRLLISLGGKILVENWEEEIVCRSYEMNIFWREENKESRLLFLGIVKGKRKGIE